MVWTTHGYEKTNAFWPKSMVCRAKRSHVHKDGYLAMAAARFNYFRRDFNCVQCPPLDRLGGKRSGRPESRALAELCGNLELEDARILQEYADAELEDPDPVEFYTYWGPNSASRIDRFYVPQSWTAEVQEVEVREQKVPSDHQQVQLLIRPYQPMRPKKVIKRSVTYPIRTAQPERVLEQLLEEMTKQEIGKATTAANWNETAGRCIQSIKRVKNKEVRRRAKRVQKLEAQRRAHLMTRRELLQEQVESTREEHEIRLGQRLERTTELLRWQFKRVSNWEKDQTVTDIININGSGFRRGMTVADKFASEWQPVLSQIHNAVPTSSMEEKFDEFVQIPEERQLNPENSLGLMTTITQDEVVQAFNSLNRHKAAGPDGLNNDFFKDTQALLVPAMVAIDNELIQGGDPPQSFLEGMIIPLRKKGDSVDAMDYRPIALLQTGYKVFAKVIATRVQSVLGIPIGDSQQGFVHGRQMLKTVMMMLAILATAREEPEVSEDGSRAILLLDFRKAYDTVARDFLLVALKKFGFSAEFVTMIQKLHKGTTAQFLVNGELSQPIPVETGIRQGCPLAPLLFILAAEILAIVIKEDSEVQGIEIPKGKGQRHKFSAVVDDSTVFLERADQLPRIMEILQSFGELSGLQVQPAKSKMIFLNTSLTVEEYRGIRMETQ